MGALEWRRNCPGASDQLVAEYRAEYKRRWAAVEAPRAEEAAQEAAHKAASDAAFAAKEQAKLAYLRTWIAEHGYESQRARSAEGLLCREEGTMALADATFAVLEGFGNPLGLSRYTNAARPTPACDNEACDAEGCKTDHSVTDSVDCLCAQQYARYDAIRTALPGASYVLRTHTAIHDCDHTPDCKAGENHGCKVKVNCPCGAMTRERAAKRGHACKLSQKGARGGGNSAVQTKLRNAPVLASQNLYLLGQFL